MGNIKPVPALVLEALLVALLSASGVLADQPSVLFDEGHGQRFLVGGEGPLQLSEIAKLLSRQGWQVRSTDAPLVPTAFREVDALVISGPFRPLSAEEVEAILDFLDRGGALAVMLHIGPPVAELLQQLGISISNGVIRESEGVLGEDALNFQVTRLEGHPLFVGLETFNIYGAWALLAHGHHASGVGKTGPHAWVDLNGNREFDGGDAMQQFSVVVAGAHGAGRFAVFGDDTLFQNRFLAGTNQLLAVNLGKWLREAHPGQPALEGSSTATIVAR